MKKVVYEFDPFELAGVEPPKSASKRREAMDEMADYIKTEALNQIGDGKSPVENGAWKRSLSPEYKKRKAEVSGVTFANMELYGDMLDALDCGRTSGTKMKFGIEGSEAPKADGHNNFSGKSELPPREFIPNEKKGQTFNKKIVNGIRQIAEEFADESED